eukprot:CAMPEP_0172429038 /NCGR_PEP_ID=MMETSP1064-20121228/48737_1 /TAXON_ID=202472 /ORGANISM="Aulacoseira subarctica , Strain CCAP 1002/5" /LENGTH=449 /DNA_ID=CAMNT_0013174157 /DNA_START=71 /DNA_END=1417 /DNA_ORIENTATION=-
MARKSLYEWLQWLCEDWVEEQTPEFLANIDAKLLNYKPYLKGKISSQLLCRLVLDPNPHISPAAIISDNTCSQSYASLGERFWQTIGIYDEFDRGYITSQVTRFCQLYGIEDTCFYTTTRLHSSGATKCEIPIPNLSLDSASKENLSCSSGTSSDAVLWRQRRNQSIFEPLSCYAQNSTATGDKEDCLFQIESRYRDLQFLADSEKENHQRNEDDNIHYADRNGFVEGHQSQYEIDSTNSPLDSSETSASLRQMITATSSADPSNPGKKIRSATIVSTASDLHQIVIHANNIRERRNKGSKKKYSWSAVAQDVGLHVKVREKYARMHNRALVRGFDFEKNGHYKIKDHQEIFHRSLRADEISKNGPINNNSLLDTTTLPPTEELSTKPSSTIPTAAKLLSSSITFIQEEHHEQLHMVDEERHKSLFEQMEEDLKVSDALTAAATIPLDM